MAPRISDFIGSASSGSLDEVYSFSQQQGLKTRTGDLGGRRVQLANNQQARVPARDQLATDAFFKALSEEVGERKALTLVKSIGLRKGDRLTKGHVQALRIELMHHARLESRAEPDKAISDRAFFTIVKGKGSKKARELIRLASLGRDDFKGVKIGLERYDQDARKNREIKTKLYRSAPPPGNANRPLKRSIQPNRAPPWAPDNRLDENAFRAAADSLDRLMHRVHDDIKTIAANRNTLAANLDTLCTQHENVMKARRAMKTVETDDDTRKRAMGVLDRQAATLRNLVNGLYVQAQKSNTPFPRNDRVNRLMLDRRQIWGKDEIRRDRARWTVDNKFARNIFTGYHAREQDRTEAIRQGMFAATANKPSLDAAVDKITRQFKDLQNARADLVHIRGNARDIRRSSNELADLQKLLQGYLHRLKTEAQQKHLPFPDTYEIREILDMKIKKPWF